MNGTKNIALVTSSKSYRKLTCRDKPAGVKFLPTLSRQHNRCNL